MIKAIYNHFAPLCQ